MSRTLRLVFVWLLALALPLQGYAAATMLNCGAAPRAVAHAMDAGHEGHAAHEGHAHHGPAGEADDAATAAHSCSACAACCVGLALPSRAPLLAAPATGVPLHAAEAVTAPHFLTDGPERPPRSPLA